jgi:hypothetical protein
MMIIQMISDGENASDIQALTSKVQALTDKYGFWNTWSVRLIAIGLVATAMYFFAQWMTNRRGNELNDAQAALIRAKDDQLSVDLKEKDVQIGRANNSANIAQERTAQLTKDAEVARAAQAEANKEIAIAKADAARAKEGTANAEAQSTKASVEVARLQVVVAGAEQKRAEAERALLELKEQLKPRHLSDEQRTKLIDILSHGPTGTFELQFLANDPESQNFADQLSAALQQAGWTLHGMGANIGPSPGVGLQIIVQNPESPRAVFLQRALGAIGFPANGTIAPGLPADTVTLLVGVKP